MRIIHYLAIGILILFLSSCKPTETITPTLDQKGTVEQGDIMLFPKSEHGYIGDPMPFFSDGSMNMFYLLDERGGTIGFHPFALLQTENFLDWTDTGTVIPYVNSISSQDLALGTGSVIQDDDGLYHAFYTGHNGTGEMPYNEKIQHATSDDMITWTKHPEDGFFGGTNDFRDPYIYYDEEQQEYWMLITTNNYSGGVIKRYISTDLWTWVNDGVFYDDPMGRYNMECPTLIKYGEYYYLSYSEQGSGNERVVHYRYTDDLSKGFTIPERDYFDGWGFYAGRIERFNDRLLLAGWVGTKTLQSDLGNYMWAGHLVVHELLQQENGELTVSLLQEWDEALSHEVMYSIEDSNTTLLENQHTFQSAAGYNYIKYEPLLAKPTKITFTADITNAKNLGLMFNAFESSLGTINIFLNIEENKIEFYKVDTNEITSATPEISFNFDFSTISTLDASMVSENGILVLYINEQVALTTRAYNAPDNPFGFFTIGSDVTIESIHFYE